MVDFQKFMKIYETEDSGLKWGLPMNEFSSIIGKRINSETFENLFEVWHSNIYRMQAKGWKYATQ